MSVEFPEANDIPEVESLNLLEFGGEQALVDTAIQHAQVALPEWTPRASSTEVVLIESLALIMGVEALALQSVGVEIVEQLMSLYGVERHEGFLAEGQVRFQVSGSEPIQVIPAGTRLRYELEDSDETVDFLTVEDATVITSETLFGTAAIEADEPGIEANNIPAGAELELVDQLTFVDLVMVSMDTHGGEGEESDESFQARAAAVLSRMNSTLVIPDNFTAAALSDPRVGRALTLDLYNPGATPKTPVAGHVTVAMLGAGGTVLDPAVMEEIRAVLSRQALASLIIHAIQPTFTTVDITCTVTRAPGYFESDVRAQIQQGLEEWLSPANWDWSPTVDQYALIAQLYDVPAVASVQSVNSTVALSGDAPLPQLGMVTVNFS